MTPKYVRSAFKRAGFPLTNGGYGNRFWQYTSSVVRITYNCDEYGLADHCDDAERQGFDTIWVHS